MGPSQYGHRKFEAIKESVKRLALGAFHRTQFKARQPLELETALGGKFPAADSPFWSLLCGWFLPGEDRTVEWQTGAIQPLIFHNETDWVGS